MRKRKVPKAVSDYMAEIGSKGGQVTGEPKRRGSSEYYRKAARARWGDKVKPK